MRACVWRRRDLVEKWTRRRGPKPINQTAADEGARGPPFRRAFPAARYPRPAVSRQNRRLNATGGPRACLYRERGRR